MKQRSFLHTLLVIVISIAFAGCSGINTEKVKLHNIVINNTQEAEDFFTWTEDRIPMVSAHRGGRYYIGYTENTIEMFEYTLSHVPAIIEFDVRRSKDGILMLMHDETTGRTATEDKSIESLTIDEIRALSLVDHKGNEVSGGVPTLEEVLDWGRGKTMFTVDVKSVSNLDDVADMIIRKNAEPFAALITYSLDVAESIHQKYPSLFLSVTLRNAEELERLQSRNIDLRKVVAFTGTSARDELFNNTLHELGIYTILGTMGNLDNSAMVRGQDVYVDLINGGADILSTDFPVEAYSAFKELIPEESSKSKFFK